MSLSKEEYDYFNLPEVKKELEDFDSRIMNNYLQYKDTDLHAMYQWSIGEIDFQTQVDLIAEMIESRLPPTPDKFIEELYGIELTSWQKLLLLKMHDNENIAIHTGRRHGRKILLDGLTEYRKRFNQK